MHKPTTAESRRQSEAMQAPALARYQLARLNGLLETILPENAFYAEKLAGLPRPLASLAELAELPFTYKEELVGGHHEAHFRIGHLAANLTYPIDHYGRFHQTSGTHGRPIVVLDTADDWQWWIDLWQYVFDAAEIGPNDRAMMAFSFGPFIGFWSAFDAAVARGCLVIPGGGTSSLARLEMLRSSEATCLLCTPSYALHLAEVASEHKIDLASLPIRRIIVAGEPGGSIPAVRARIERAWDARLIDHGGACEAGPWGYGDRQGLGLHVIESEFIAEFFSIETGNPAAEGELSELVLTNLGRAGCPLLRYRTGDLVRPNWHSDGANRFVHLTGGVLGRTDDMMIIRGVNIFPAAIEQILRGFPEVVEYRMTATKVSEMDHLVIEVEDRQGDPARLAQELRLRLGLRIDVESVPLGSLPRYEAKGKRFVDKRPVDKRSVDKRSVDKRSVDKRSVDKQ